MILSKAGGRDSKGLGANYLSSKAPPGVPTMDSLIITSLSIEVEEKTIILVQGHRTLTLSFTFYLGYQPSALPLPQPPLSFPFSPFPGPLFSPVFIPFPPGIPLACPFPPQFPVH